jgi:hypothetical protein
MYKKIWKHQYKFHGQSENNILSLVTWVCFVRFISAMLECRITIVQSEFSSQQMQRYFQTGPGAHPASYPMDTGAFPLGARE